MKKGEPEPAPKMMEEDRRDEEGFDEGEEGSTMKAIRDPGEPKKREREEHSSHMSRLELGAKHVSQEGPRMIRTFMHRMQKERVAKCR